MDAAGERWGNLMLLMLLAALLAMVGVLMPVTGAARINTCQPETVVEPPVTADFPAPVAASAIGEHYHEWSQAIEFFRRGAATR